MASKFFEVLEQNKIDERRLLNASKRIERLRHEDRALKLAKRGEKGDAKKESEGDAAPPAKPRSGRPVTKRLLNDVRAGRSISGAAKTRLVRALNHILEQKQQNAVEIRAVF